MYALRRFVLDTPARAATTDGVDGPEPVAGRTGGRRVGCTDKLVVSADPGPRTGATLEPEHASTDSRRTPMLRKLRSRSSTRTSWPRSALFVARRRPALPTRPTRCSAPTSLTARSSPWTSATARSDRADVKDNSINTFDVHASWAWTSWTGR